MSDSPKKPISQQLFGNIAKRHTAQSIDDVQDNIIYTIEEDRGYLLSYIALRLVGVFIALFFSFLMWVFANRTGNVAFLVAFIIGLTVAWFFTKGLGKKSSRFISHVPVVSFGKENVFIFETSDKEHPLIVGYNGITAYKIIRQGNALQLLIKGEWVTHPSGFYLISIRRPFMKTTLDEIQEQIKAIFRNNKVKEIAS